MDLHHEAEAHLRTIRTLMERATVYRAISAPTARVAAILGLACGTVPDETFSVSANGWDFKALWLGALVVTLVANAYFIFRGAKRRGDQFLSPGMRMTARAVAPPALCGLVATLVLAPPLLPAVWMVCYGLALLATATFAPRTIVILGWAFLGAGLALCLRQLLPGHWPSPQSTMFMSFGFFHAIYVAYIWGMGDSDQPAASTASGTNAAGAP